MKISWQRALEGTVELRQSHWRRWEELMGDRTCSGGSSPGIMLLMSTKPSPAAASGEMVLSFCSPALLSRVNMISMRTCAIGSNRERLEAIGSDRKREHDLD